ncbi:hypothetical protein VNO77_10465 [Canavalia gladiata]|uniref:Protein EXORDIUM-like 2 n=1 Tax=Canavalia gladiata TaxID=3824 RepID=A0AAN9MBT7_CANGL
MARDVGQTLSLMSLAIIAASFVLVQSHSHVTDNSVVLIDHKGPLLKGNVEVDVLWYGNFTSNQRSIIIDFIESLSSNPQSQRQQSPSVFSWWQTTARYRGGPSIITVGNQKFDHTYSLGKSLKSTQLLTLALENPKKTRGNAIHVILTSADVAVEGFCMNRCGTHGSGGVQKDKIAFAWVGNPQKQCPGQCAFPFAEPVYGPKTRPLVPPNGDVGVDGLIINLATVLAGTVTNPFNNGYYQGSALAPLEAVSACSGIFGTGAFPGYAGKVLVDKKTGASYNAVGVRGGEFLLPAMWDPVTSTCKTLL